MSEYMGMVQLKVSSDGIWRVIKNEQCLLETTNEKKARALYEKLKHQLEYIKQQESRRWVIVDELR